MPQAQVNADFSQRTLLKSAAVAVGYLLLSIAEGWSGKTVLFEAGLLFGLGGLGSLGERLLWRRYLRGWRRH